MPCGNMFSKLLFYSVTILGLLGPLTVRADYAVLDTGFRLRVERRENQGPLVRLFITGGGYVDVAPSRIHDYEVEEAAPVLQPAPQPLQLPDMLANAGRQHGLDPVFLQSMIAEESGFHERAVSPKGAAGLMQLMPATAESLGVKDSFNAAENIQGGTQYLRMLVERYNGDVVKALAAYNAGPGKVDRYRGIPPYAETQRYVRRVITRFNKEKLEQSEQ